MPTKRTPHRPPPRKRTPAFKFTAAQQEEFLTHIRAGMRRGAAADVVFGSDDPACRRKVREYIDTHGEFEILVEDAEIEATEHVEEALYQAAVSGNVPAATKWLELHGRKFEEHRGRPSNKPPDLGDDPFGDLGGVVSLDDRRKKSS
jgi:hypothetical protein